MRAAAAAAAVKVIVTVLGDWHGYENMEMMTMMMRYIEAKLL